MKKEIKEVYAEVHELFKYIPEEQVEKVPKKLRDFIEQEKKENHSINIV